MNQERQTLAQLFNKSETQNQKLLFSQAENLLQELQTVKNQLEKSVQETQTPLLPNASPIPFPNCLPQFGRHKWTAFAVLLPQGKISQCQFCFHEKLTPHSPQDFTQYFPPQTFYIR